MNDTSISVASCDTFVISIPTGWAEMAVEPGMAIERLRTALSEDPDVIESVDVRRHLLMLGRLLQDAQDRGVAFCAILDETVAAGGDDYQLLAVCVLTTVPAAVIGAEALTFDDVRRSVEGNDDTAPLRFRDTLLTPLAGGPAVRETLLHETFIAGLDEEVKVLQDQFHTLIGPGEGLGILTFLTPNVEVADEMMEHFEAIAKTLEFVAA